MQWCNNYQSVDPHSSSLSYRVDDINLKLPLTLPLHAVIVYSFPNFKILGGTNVLMDYSNGNVYEVERVVLHPDYGAYRNSIFNDIGLLKIKGQMEFSPFTYPIELGDIINEKDVGEATIAGWGLTQVSWG